MDTPFTMTIWSPVLREQSGLREEASHRSPSPQACPEGPWCLPRAHLRGRHPLVPFTGVPRLRKTLILLGLVSSSVKQGLIEPTLTIRCHHRREAGITTGTSITSLLFFSAPSSCPSLPQPVFHILSFCEVGPRFRAEPFHPSATRTPEPFQVLPGASCLYGLSTLWPFPQPERFPGHEDVKHRAGITVTIL